MEYKKSKVVQQKNNNYNGVGKDALQLKDNRSKALNSKKTTQLMGLDEEEDLQLKADTTQKMGLEEEDEFPMQMKENNTGLPDNLKSGIENISGYSMDDVKVYYNSSEPAQLNAHAYAQGTDIHIGSGQEKHLPHEAWHVVQQKQGRVQPTTSFGGAQINDNEGLENEADVMGGKALQMVGMKGINVSKQLKTIKPTNFQRKKAIQLMTQLQGAVEGNVGWNEVSKNWANTTHQLKGKDWQAIQCVAMERFQSRINSDNQVDVAQLLESSTWDMISDAITITSLIATATTAIAVAASASGLGWLVPMAIGLIGGLVVELIGNQEKTTPEVKSNEEKIKQKNIKSITNFAGALAIGVMGVLAATESSPVIYKAIGATITIALMAILEVLRVRNLSRDTVYGIVLSKLKSLRGGEESEPLIV
ncbi:DUF4157 domain-containing protein [Tenacibaculum halocynthiae]|uniref:eCIS core domain-containing protein n=1 Tax=Tenacibaculum halocynthiae TaxID=1254437 RepID=UPI003D65D0A8